MMQDDADDAGVRVQLGQNRVIVISEARIEQFRSVVRTVLREPFTRRTWSELTFFLLSGLVGAVGIVFIAATMGAGLLFLITFVGVIIIAACIRGARGFG